MAFKKQLELNNGVLIEHWEIAEMHFDKRTNTLKIAYEGYVSKLAKDEGKLPVVSSIAQIDTIDDAPLAQEVIEYSETKVRSLPEFIDSEDVE